MTQPRMAKLINIASGATRKRVLARRDALVLAHVSLVEGIARAVHRGLPPGFDLADLLGVGHLACVRAATRYRPAQYGQTPFAAFARASIRGAIIESVRRRNYLEATRPGLDVIPMRAKETDTPHTLGELMRDPAATDPADAIDETRRRNRVSYAISWLPASQRQVLELYYSPGQPTMAQVAEQMQLMPRQVQTLHSQAIHELRARLLGGAIPRDFPQAA